MGPIAASFRLLGVGFWQGRLAGVAFTAGALALMWLLARAIDGRRAAWVTLAALLVVTYPDPVTVGRHALAEMPAMFYLVAGYALARPGLGGRLPWLLPAALAWALALSTKAQVTPFWLASIGCALALALARRWYGRAGLLAALAGAAWIGRAGVARLYAALPRDLSEAPVEGLYEVSAAVIAAPARAAALKLVLTYAGPALLGLAYGGWRLLRDARDARPPPERLLLRTALWGLAASWLAWFAVLSPAWARYLFPAAFLAGPFVARLFLDCLPGPGMGGTARRLGALAAPSTPFRERARAAALIVVVTLGAANAVRALADHAFAHRDRGGLAVQAAAGFLNRRTPPGSRIETYDPELMFLLDRPYHYPPDQLHVALNRRLFLDARTPVAYDPLAADPDYLVTGPLPRLWRLYDPVVSSPAFRLVARFGEYLVYERVRR